MELENHNFTEVHILGHSLADVDIPYFRSFLIMNSVRFAKWYVSYRENKSGKRNKERDLLYLKFFRISGLRKLPIMITINSNQSES